MKSGAILGLEWVTKKLVSFKKMAPFGSKPGFSNKTDEQLWYEISENLSELSRRDAVQYRVRASKESVLAKLEELKENGKI